MNPQQAAALGFPGRGAVLVLAGAGSGKTTVLTRRVALLLERFPEAGILALTFTKDAAEEMATRLRALVGADASMVSFPTIGTFHAFAFGLIRSDSGGISNWARLGFASCPSLLEPAEAASWLKAAKRGLEPDVSQEQLQEWLESPFTMETEASGPNEAPARGAETRRADVREEFRRYLQASGRIAFGDMVALALRLLSEHPQVLAQARTRYRHILVDEFQDTSRDQLELVKLLAGSEPSLFLVGDDDQAIYGFRGADPGNIDAALGHFPGMGIIKLETNYRSSAAIVAYANAVFRDKAEGLRKRLEAGRSLGSAPVKIAAHRNGAGQAAWMVSEMRRLRREEGLAWKDMAVLFRLNILKPYYRSMLARLAGEDAARDVILSTVHASKGLEYPAVFFAGLEDGILPYRRGKEPLAPERLAEERRIFYVGVTRAQRFLYLCSCRRRVLRGKTVEAEASPFLRAGATGPGSRWFGGARALARGAGGLWDAFRAFRGKKGEP
ncbi:MAG TPA: ATP-dependent helicase [Fibrobacteria bacterium]|nr:ATP-dependent helicase [Fibrobacteria bacterium]